MGACQSCVGGRKRHYDEDDENRPLYEDGNGMQYGSFGDAALHGESDTVEAQRESEALEAVVAKASHNMVDVFEIAPQDKPARAASMTFAYAGQGARVARYQHLISKLSIGAEDDLGTSSAGIKVDWVADDENMEMQSNRPASIKTVDKDGGPMVGTFADAAAAAV